MFHMAERMNTAGGQETNHGSKYKFKGESRLDIQVCSEARLSLWNNDAGSPKDT